MGKPCIAGAEEIDIDVDGQTLTANGTTLHEGDWMSLDGTTGEVFAGRISTIEPDFKRETELITLLELGRRDAHARRLGQRRHARGSRARALARRQRRRPGAHRAHVPRGGPPAVRAGHDPGRARRQARRRARPARRTCRRSRRSRGFQTGDFYGILKAMDGLPVVIRLIDPPLHEFLPKHDKLLEEVTARARPRRDRPRARREGAPASRPSRACTSRTRCSACAAVGSASCSPRSSRCRSRPSRRPPRSSRRKA